MRGAGHQLAEQLRERQGVVVQIAGDPIDSDRVPPGQVVGVNFLLGFAKLGGGRILGLDLVR